MTVYLLALAVFMPVVGRVADRFGRRKVLVTALVMSWLSRRDQPPASTGER